MVPSHQCYAARVSGAGAGLRSLEVRTSTEDGISSTMDLARTVSELRIRLGRQDGRAIGLSEKVPCEVGLILHFTRDPGAGAKEGRNTAHWLLSHADPCRRRGGCTNPSGYRYAHFYRLKRTDALAFAGTMLGFPLSLEVLRGVDVCTDELGVPCWVLSPLLRHVRQASADASALLRDRMGVVVPSAPSTRWSSRSATVIIKPRVPRPGVLERSDANKRLSGRVYRRQKAARADSANSLWYKSGFRNGKDCVIHRDDS
jgi:hypothetical protein